MGEPYIGEIRLFAGNFPPNGWAFCEGQLVPISENDALFILLGTMYGGDGQSTFALPDLRGRIPLHFGTGPDGITYQQAEAAGGEEVTLTTQQISVHTPAQLCRTGSRPAATAPVHAIASKATRSEHGSAGATVSMGNPPMQSDIAGGSQPHTNFMPYLCINFIISLFGRFPSQT